MALQGRPAKPRSLFESRAQDAGEYRRLQADIDEARPRDLGLRDIGIVSERGGDLDGELARIGEMRARLLRINHRRIGGKIAMRRVARRLDDKALQIEVGRQAAARGDPAQD